MTPSATLLAVIYFGLFIGGLIFVALIRKRFRKRRAPLEFAYIREPGYSLKERIQDQNDKLAYHLLLSLFVPLSAFYITAKALIAFDRNLPGIVWIPICAIASLAGLALAYRSLIGHIDRLSNLELGLEGECVVADFLKPLEQEGWSVFHDIPATSNGRKFNLDHVAIGPSGVALIETKTRRKGKTIQNREEHVVAFDGQRLTWPWGESTSELVQLKRQREWFEKWIHDLTGKRISILPILAIPGWWIASDNAKARTRVVNHKCICAAVKGDSQKTLDAETIDLLSRQLRAICLIKK